VIPTFQPNPSVVGSGRAQVGNPFDRFIAGNMDCIYMEEGRTEADFTAGFAALRKIEMRRIADKHGLELDENMAGEDMKARMQQWFLEGKLPIPDPPKMIDEAALREQIKQELREELGLQDPPGTSDDGLDDLSWDDLRGKAVELGVFEKSLNRVQLTERIRDVG